VLRALAGPSKGGLLTIWSRARTVIALRKNAQALGARREGCAYVPQGARASYSPDEVGTRCRMINIARDGDALDRLRAGVERDFNHLPSPAGSSTATTQAARHFSRSQLKSIVRVTQ